MRWPVIAVFKFKDSKVNISTKLRIRSFEFDVWSCERHGNIRIRPGDNFDCVYCKEPLKKSKKSMYAIYTKAEPYINLAEVLSRHTLSNFKSLIYRMNQASVIAYCNSIEDAMRTLEFEQGSKDGVEVSIAVDKTITQDQMDKLFHQAQKEKIIKKI